jgi:hypothetical protein
MLVSFVLDASTEEQSRGLVLFLLFQGPHSTLPGRGSWRPRPTTRCWSAQATCDACIAGAKENGMGMMSIVDFVQTRPDCVRFIGSATEDCNSTAPVSLWFSCQGWGAD